MPIVLRQDMQLARLISRIERGAIRAKHMTSGIEEDALLWRPPEGGWGIAHFLEHAMATAQPYLRRLPPVIKKARRRRRFAENGKWKLSLPGGIVRWTVGSDNGAGTAPRFTRMPAPDSDVLRRFLTTQAKIAKMLRSADGLSLDKIHCRMGGAVWWRLSDCCTILVARTERDLAGAKNVREHPDFLESQTSQRDRSES